MQLLKEIYLLVWNDTDAFISGDIEKTVTSSMETY